MTAEHPLRRVKQNSNTLPRFLVLLLLIIPSYCSDSSIRISRTRPARRRVSPGGYVVLLRQKPAAAAAEAISPSAGVAAAAAAQTGVASPRSIIRDARVQAYAQQVDSSAATIAARAGVSNKVRYRYRYSLSGFSTSSLTAQEINALKQDPDVLGVFKDGTVQARTFSIPRFLGLTGAATTDGSGGIWPQLGGKGAARAGEGVVIGVIDSGIWPETDCFSDRATFGPAGLYSYTKLNSTYYSGTCEAGDQFTTKSCNRKVIGCTWFNQGLLGGGTDIRAVYPDEVNSCRDVQGHGDHTASIAAGNFGIQHPLGTSSGVAPRARLAIYKVLWGPDLLGALSDVTAAIDQAVADGVDIINFSAGPIAPSKSFRRLTDMAMLYAAQAGILITGACGNTGPEPGTVDFQAPWVMSVGASSHDRAMRAAVQLGNGKTLTGAGVEGVQIGPVKMVLGSSVKAPRVNKTQAALCNPYTLNPRKATGKVVICDRGRGTDYDFAIKANEVARAGGVGMLLVNVAVPRDDITAIKYSVPTVHLPRRVRTSLLNYAATALPTVMLLPAQPVYNQLAPQIARISSRGPALAGGGVLLKPDIVAPGVEVFAAWSPGDAAEPLPYLYQTGTSMSAPHVAGLAALLRQKYPYWSPMAIKSALMTTAYQKTRTGTPGLSFGSPFDYGAGHVDPKQMLNPGLVFDSTYRDWLNFLCGAERWPGDQFCGPCDSNPPPDGCDPANFNAPSIAVPNLAVGVPKIVTRVLKSVLSTAMTFIASPSYENNAAQFIDVMVDQQSIFMDPGGARKVKITVQVKEGAVHGRYYFAAMTWTGASGTITRIPIAISASLLTVPNELAVSLLAPYASFAIRPAFTGTLNLVVMGPVPAVITQKPIVAGEGVDVQVTAPAGSSLIAFRLFQADMPSSDYDLDFCLAKGDPLNPEYTDCQESPTSNESLYITLPQPLTTSQDYVVNVYGYKVPSGPVTFTLYSWFIGNFQDAPTMQAAPQNITTQLGADVAIDVGFSGLNISSTPPQKYLGLLQYVKDGVVLETTRVLVS